MTEPIREWYAIRNPEACSTPALLVYPDRIRSNIQTMLSMVDGQAERLCPHVKTVKTVEIIRYLVEAGVHQFKCATVAEGEVTLMAGAKSVLLALQPAQVVATRWLSMAAAHPEAHLPVVVDNQETLNMLSALCRKHQQRLTVWLDLDIGMHRTGIQTGKEAIQLVDRILADEQLDFGGLHAYDGHLHQPPLSERDAACAAWFSWLQPFINSVRDKVKHEVPTLAGGTPTFPVHARNASVICSPGTCVLWDAGYAHHFKDLDFNWAAVLAFRVISKPLPGHLCLDLGHKSVASEMTPPRIQCLNLEVDAFITHSEEHLVVTSKQADATPVGTMIYGVPWHVCPTVALHHDLLVVESGEITQSWEVLARRRKIRF